ncbi:MAG: short-chain dehydrogenase [Marivirga sp.]|nr:short-chain dehydrogenase [Marivirga sp.]
MILTNKVAVIYGGGGAIGGAVAKAFATEGAKVYLCGRTLSTLDRVAAEISNHGYRVEISKVDALMADEVRRHLESVVKKEGCVDISFNAIGLDDVQGAALTAMNREEFLLPIVNGMNTHFITATSAARIMAVKSSGVILAITANASRKPYTNVGGFGVVCAAVEAFCRQLALEAGPNGVRVVCLRSAGSPDTPGVDDVFKQHALNAGITRTAFEKDFAERTMLKRLPRLNEVASAAVLAVSDYSSAITAAVINVTCGELAD